MAGKNKGLGRGLDALLLLLREPFLCVTHFYLLKLNTYNDHNYP